MSYFFKCVNGTENRFFFKFAQEFVILVQQCFCNGDLSVFRCVDGLHQLDLITHLVLVWRSDLPDSPSLSTVNLAVVSRWWIALRNTSVSHRASLLLKEFASLMVVHQEWRQLARQMEGEKALLPLCFFSLKREQLM